MKFGDPIWYRQTSRGGYGFQRDVPALYDHLAGLGKRIGIVVLLKSGERKTIYVDPKNVRPRDPAATFDPFSTEVK